MAQPPRIDFTTIRKYLTDPCWHEIDVWEIDHDNRAIGVLLAALSKLMLPYWQARYRRDVTMEQLVQLLEAWALAPSAATQRPLFDQFQSSEAHFFDEDKYNDTAIRRDLNSNENADGADRKITAMKQVLA